MFNDKYRRDNEKIAADPALKAYIKNKMANQKQSHSRAALKILKSAAALALCAAITVGAVFAHDRFASAPNLSDTPLNELISIDDETALSPVSYSDVYLLASKQYDQIKASQPTKGIGVIFDYFTTDDAATDEIWIEEEALVDTENYAQNGTVTTPTSTDNATDSPSPTDSDDYSGTNNQVEGVDEGDIIKTDGKYIYTLSLSKASLTITKADNGKLEVLSTTEIKNTDFYCGSGAEMYIYGDKVAVVSCLYDSEIKTLRASSATRTKIDVFDCANKSSPKLIKTFAQDGLSHSTRLIGSKLYLITRYSELEAKPDEDNPETYVPRVYEDDECTTVESDSLYVSADYSEYSFVLISSYDINALSSIDSVAVMGSCETIYMSTSSLYICSGKSKDTQNYTLISRFSVDSGEITLKSLGSVPGTVLNQFSLDEYNGNLRMVTTVENYKEQKDTVTYYTASGSVVEDYVSYSLDERTNALYVLDSDLKVIGKIEGLAKDERIYSARFMGDAAYFVTFRETDPLFSVDLKDPANPKILGELKIPGFSEYLHPYGDGLLFGFGQEADEKTGRTLGLKLSMFDISDPANTAEISKLLLDDSWSIAESNHKAFLISYTKNLIGFPGEKSFLVYSYTNDDGFIKKAEVAFDSWDSNSRMLYIGDYIYIYSDLSRITSMSMTGFEIVDSISF